MVCILKCGVQGPACDEGLHVGGETVMFQGRKRHHLTRTC